MSSLRRCGGCRGRGVKEFRDFGEVATIYETFKDHDARSAICHVTSAVVDWRGQVVTMADRAYLTEAMPLCVIWGEDDRVIPAAHAGLATALAPGARVEVIPNAGHFPHKDHPSGSCGSSTTSSARPSPRRTHGLASARC